MTSSNYINTIDDYIQSNENYSDVSNSEFFNKLFFTYPSTNVDTNTISLMTNQIASEFKIPYHDIKVIGSSHLGFSLVKPYGTNQIKLFNMNDSDIDFAIVNKELFYKVFSLTTKSTNFYSDLTTFSSAKNHHYYMSNLPLGFIRPDTIGNTEFRSNWLRFFEDMSHDFNIKTSAAIYLDENCFHQRINKAFKIYIERMGLDGVK
ncbi:MAG: hypothetical protein E7A63_14770 [Clostridium butyricum]|nr:hypothetical protein [Clostridium butyricum]